MDEPELSRKRKGPARYDSSEPFYPNSCEEMYKQIYFEAYDYTINGIEKRLNQPDYRMYVITISTID